MKNSPGRRIAQNDLPYPFTGSKVIGWGGGGGVVAHKILLSAPVPIGPLFLLALDLDGNIGIWTGGLGLGLDNCLWNLSF